MVIVQINGSNLGSTGNVVFGIADVARKRGHFVYIFSPPGHTQKKGIYGNYFIGTVLERRICDFINDCTGMQGSLNYIGTLNMIRKIKELNPDIIHLHNLHGNYLNLKLLFNFLSEYKGKVFWTLHDCWAFTGNCPHFSMLKCEKWKTKCTKCNYKGYPKGKGFDCTEWLFKKKKEMFTSVHDMTIIAPSQWLADLVKMSFLSQYPVRVINNGINLEIFKPVSSNFRERHGIQGGGIHYSDGSILLGYTEGFGYRS